MWCPKKQEKRQTLGTKTQLLSLLKQTISTVYELYNSPFDCTFLYYRYFLVTIFTTFRFDNVLFSVVLWSFL